MKEIIVVASIGVTFILYCSIRVGAQEDRQMEEMRRRKEMNADGEKRQT